MTKDCLTLTELNLFVREIISEAFPETYWLVSEISDVRQASNGHCYFEFIEKNPQTGILVAKAKGNIWNSTFRMLKPYFEQSTGQLFTSGIKVLVKVSVEFHELYGYSLTVLDIDPSYTLGDLQRQRQMIIHRLEEEGILNLNKELDFPSLPQKIAVITSASAAGYEDFLDQLKNNSQRFVFYPTLFPAVMQGEKTEKSIITALDQIYEHVDLFDLVVIIRGGGATSDLHSFDSYDLAANCAQFPLPIITGIGHERDETLLDAVANKRMKTPTAVAEILIETVMDTYAELLDVQNEIISLTKEKLLQRKQDLQISALKLTQAPKVLLEKQSVFLRSYPINLKKKTALYFFRRKQDLENAVYRIKLFSPEHILSKGYSITLKDGKPVKSASVIKKGDRLKTIFQIGSIESIVD